MSSLDLPVLIISSFMDGSRRHIILDGEVPCVDPATGVSDFEAVMSRFRTKKLDKIQRLANTLPATYVIFNILQYKGQDPRGLPLMDRKAILSTLSLPSSSFGLYHRLQKKGQLQPGVIEHGPDLKTKREILRSKQKNGIRRGSQIRLSGAKDQGRSENEELDQVRHAA